MAVRLRRQTRNLLGSSSAGSNLANYKTFFLGYFILKYEHGK